MTIGETLKRARKKMNLDLDDVVRATKIAKMFLIALENDDISSLPKGVYTRNFLRTYARFLKLDEDIITTEYHEQYAIKPHFVVQQEQTVKDNSEFKQSRNRGLLIGTILFVIPLIAGALYYHYGDGVKERVAEWTGGEVPQTAPAVEKAPTEPFRPTQTETTQPATVPGATNVNDPNPPQTQPTQTDPPSEPEETETGDPADPPVEAGDSTALDKAAVAAEDTDAALVGAVDEAEDKPAVPLVFSDPQTLPIRDLGNATWLPAGCQPGDMAGMFAIEALADVWIKLTIDGDVVTERILPSGQVRYYCYGETHELLLGNSWSVAIQDGGTFRARSHAIQSRILFPFGSGQLLTALDDKMKNNPALEDAEEN